MFKLNNNYVNISLVFFSYYKVKLTVESESEDTMTEVCDFIQSNLPEGR